MSNSLESPSSIITTTSTTTTTSFKYFHCIHKNKGICWHFRRNGFCKRGKTCPYEHLLEEGLDLEHVQKRSQQLLEYTLKYRMNILNNNNNMKKKKKDEEFITSSLLDECSSSNVATQQLNHQVSSHVDELKSQYIYLENIHKEEKLQETQKHSRVLCYWISKAKELKLKESALRRTFEGNGFTLVSSLMDESTHYLAVFWGHTFPRYNIVKWNELPSYTLINQFPNSHELCNKSLMALNFQRLIQLENSVSPSSLSRREKVEFTSKYVPPSFYLPQQLELFLQYAKEERFSSQQQQDATLNHGSGYVDNHQFWIVKPHRSGEGRGITIYSSYREVIQHEFSDVADIILCEHNTGSVTILNENVMKQIKNKKIVVSKYITNPLLVNNKKFDLRMYVLVVGKRHHEERDRIYFYRDGIVRFASEDYTLSKDNLNNHFMHITNNSVNDKKNKVQNETIIENFGFFSNMYLSDLKDYFLQHEWKELWCRLDELVLQSIHSTILNPEKQDELFHSCRHRCFQLYGYDILIDETIHPHLLEVNLMPDLAGVNQSLVLSKNYGLKAKMLANALNLVSIPIDANVDSKDTVVIDTTLPLEENEKNLLGDFVRLQ
ncbi:hypothetical protein FDP41_012546 [Naegleria fowleri]|uniref:Tubulin--tyrosine ligase-like protein 5 n=1 Tax=Naegleria fowleri TaxID=5763 RepID=A0A6A5C0S7_NAEFO|nr:uncharacterized protein FDP41_012546 [Naegleria fowleri]KAF0981286.1 hypothetical protein FDP41_012546 [Naegleria fowleri]